MSILFTKSRLRSIQWEVMIPIFLPSYLTGTGYDGRHGLDRGLFNIEGEERDVFDIAKSDPSRFVYSHRIAEFQLDQDTGTGLIESTFGYAEDWQYVPSLQCQY